MSEQPPASEAMSESEKVWFKKPVAITAIRFTEESKNRCYNFVRCNCYPTFDDEGKPTLRIETLEGDMTASLGDYIIRGVKGEFYPVKPDIFEATYTDDDVLASLTATVEQQRERIAELERRLKVDHEIASVSMRSLSDVVGVKEDQDDELAETQRQLAAATERAERAEKEAERLQELVFAAKETLHPQSWKYHQPSHSPPITARFFDLNEALIKVCGQNWEGEHEAAVAALLASGEGKEGSNGE